MADLLGIIAPLKKFLSNTDEKINISLDNKKRVVLSLEKNRIYNIPDFQREIRWSCDNVAILIEDIKSRPRFLGNIILTKHSEKNYSIIDGQQRITILTMVLKCIKELHNGKIDLIDPCKLTIDSFSKFPELLDYSFDEQKITVEVHKSDKLKQVNKYVELWKYISKLDEITNKRHAKKIIENLETSTFNIIINEADDVGEGIRYFIDVNLKGKQLDIEDIFKSYLFRNDSSKEIREQWYLLKTLMAEVDCSKMDYPLLKLLEHYLLCDLYSENNYRGMEFGTDFLLKKQYNDGTETHREGTHIIELIHNNQYMKKSLMQINGIVELMLEIVNSDSITSSIKKVFTINNGKSLDNIELKVIHNIIGKILKDAKILPKALLVKYFLILLYGTNGKSKENIQTIYGIYLFTVLFTLFENKKSAEVLIKIVKVNELEWYSELIKQIDNYFTPDRITDAKLLAQYKFAQNEEEEDQRFRCKSLATVYNYFVNSNGKVSVRKGKMPDLYKFITDDASFSIEHFIVSESQNRNILVEGNQYTIDKAIYKRYVNNFFNFIFINEELNSTLANNWLPQKLLLLEDEVITCEYSNMIISKLNKLGREFKKKSGKKYIDKLDFFFYKDFKELYIDYSKAVLEDVINRINCH